MKRRGWMLTLLVALMAAGCTSCAGLYTNVAYTAPDKEGELMTRTYGRSLQTVRELTRIAVGSLDRWSVVGEYSCCEKDEDLLRPVKFWEPWEAGALPSFVGAVQVEVTSKIWGFVDDLTIFIVPTSAGTQVDVYSASRIGKGDLGANAQHIRELLKLLDELVAKAEKVHEVREEEGE